jgi:hypothetical protein
MKKRSALREGSIPFTRSIPDYQLLSLFSDAIMGYNETIERQVPMVSGAVQKRTK